MTNRIIQGDCLEVLMTLASNSVDAICTDPPSGINFMGKDWDKDKGGRDAWVAWLSSIMTEALRVIKPGGHILVWSLPRTSHWTGYAIENAGFEIRDTIDHIFGSGMPKSHNVSVAIDKHLKAERKVIATIPDRWAGKGNVLQRATQEQRETANITAPATPEAEQYDGWGTGLKPAKETWWLARKPLAEATIAGNVLAYGTGAINIDATRITLTGIEHHKTPGSDVIGTDSGIYGKSNEVLNSKQVARAEQGLNPRYEPLGRWPSNTLFSHSENCVANGVKRVSANRWGKGSDRHGKDGQSIFNMGKQIDTIGYEGEDGTELVESWQCDPSCPVRLLDEQSGISTNGGGPHASTIGFSGKASHIIDRPKVSHTDTGTASRYYQCFPPFIYQAKPSKRERNAGCEALPASAVHRYGAGIGEGLHPEAPVVEKNNHPTVKSINLMKYLVRMITPPGGTVLDCFMGSGSTGAACVLEGFNFIGIERELEYVQIAQARISYYEQHERTEPHVQTWECSDDCPVAELDRQSGHTKGHRNSVSDNRSQVNGSVALHDTRSLGMRTPENSYSDEGGASRFFAQLLPDMEGIA